ncbi:amidase [Oricola cellulosilytica]|uniref:Amidase n=1 Tax=Oricola cellulosilytica TaxID=1429082 RepID=A0A4R0PF80_9HYPH|nr:amidase [Oricola cellulosilytica]TCD16486.1 amidase [Oricola cellulosilytica]
MAAKASVADLTALEMRDRIASGALTAVELAHACIERVKERDDHVGAWAWFDADFVVAQAGSMDSYRKTGKPLGALHGVPVGLKDIIDTARIPTENGCPIDEGRIPENDAAVVEKLKSAGAIIFGKTVTTELAFMHPSATRNPAGPEHTPGGSSAGSAAAVAAGMVPLAVATQTGGSIIRPAAFCGVVGFKPSFGAVSRRGVLNQSPSLDTVGVFARNIGDTAFLGDTLFGSDPSDPATRPSPPPKLLDHAKSDPPVRPTFAFVRTPFWEAADDDTQAAFDELTALLGNQCFEIELPPIFADSQRIRETINLAEMAKSYARYLKLGRDSLSPTILGAIESGRGICAPDYIAALDWPKVFNAGLNEIFERCDAIITPSAPGAAPLGLETTGDPVFNGLWTLCGTPTVTIPVFEAENGMPMGVQIVGPKGQDGRLLRTARWLFERIGNGD